MKPPQAIRKVLLLACLLWSCSTQTNPWVLDHISAGNQLFDSSRLRYASAQAHPPLCFEMIKVGDQIESFLSLTRFRLTAAETATVIFQFGNQSLEEQIPIHEGRMRLRLPEKTTQRLIQALQDGYKIAILLDDFEETLDPSQFSSSFAKFRDGNPFFQNLFKGPIP